jgi:hypothetical protein
MRMKATTRMDGTAVISTDLTGGDALTDLFDVLAEMVASDRRDVWALETADILPEAIFASDVIPFGRRIAVRTHERRQWLTRVQSTVEEANMVFLDPDNGLEPAGYSHAGHKHRRRSLCTARQRAEPGQCSCLPDVAGHGERAVRAVAPDPD